MEMNRYLYHCNVRNLTKLTIHHLNETLKPFRQILSTTPSYFAMHNQIPVFIVSVEQSSSTKYTVDFCFCWQ